MKAKAVVSILLMLVFFASARAELTIVSTNHRDADSFKRLSEFFTGKESPGRYAILRTVPSRRDGFYISLLGKDKTRLSSVATVRIRFVRPNEQNTESIDLPVSSITKRRILVGMTEREWEGVNERPVAWKIELLDSNNRLVDQAKSFLWTEPSN